MLAARGAQPVAAAAAYELPFRVAQAAAAVALATVLEDRLSAAYLGLVGLSDPRCGRSAPGRSGAAALRAAAWRGRRWPFPGSTCLRPARSPPARGPASLLPARPPRGHPPRARHPPARRRSPAPTGPAGA